MTDEQKAEQITNDTELPSTEIKNESINISNSNNNNIKNIKKKGKKRKKLLKPEQQIPRGKPKSNRSWKTPKTKFGTIKKTLPRLPLQKKIKLRHELKAIKEHSKEIKEERKQVAIAKHQRRLENAERRLANEKRAEIVQIIKNPAKLKRLKKKQLRQIEKRDLSKVKVV